MTPGRDVLKDSLAAYLLVIYSGPAMVETYLRYVSSIAPAGSPQGLRSVFPMEEGTV